MECEADNRDAARGAPRKDALEGPDEEATGKEPELLFARSLHPVHELGLPGVEFDEPDGGEAAVMVATSARRIGWTSRHIWLLAYTSVARSRRASVATRS